MERPSPFERQALCSTVTRARGGHQFTIRNLTYNIWMEQMEQWNTTLFFEWKKHPGAFQTPYHLV